MTDAPVYKPFDDPEWVIFKQECQNRAVIKCLLAIIVVLSSFLPTTFRGVAMICATIIVILGRSDFSNTRYSIKEIEVRFYPMAVQKKKLRFLTIIFLSLALAMTINFTIIHDLYHSFYLFVAFVLLADAIFTFFLLRHPKPFQ